jgi:hypothetical protein
MQRAILPILAAVGVLVVVGAFRFAFSRRKDDQLRSMRLAVFSAVVTFVAATAVFIAIARVHHFNPSGGMSSTTGIQILFTSQTYDPGTARFSLNGVARGLKPEQELWVVFRGPQRDRLYFPAPTPCGILPENQFSCQQVITGNLSPGTAKVRGLLIAAVPEVADIFRRYNSGSLGTAGLHELPDGATVVSQISIGS